MKIECKICQKKIKNENPYIGSHVKRIHDIPLNDYVIKYYGDLNSTFKYESCGFCNNDAVPTFNINHNNQTFSRCYDNGFLCKTDICKNNISESILNKSIDKSFEHIGSNILYIMGKYKISKSDALTYKSKSVRSIMLKENVERKNAQEILRKYKENIKENPGASSLERYVLRHGEKKGLEKYNIRCAKISKSNTKQWYLDKFGDIVGNNKWNTYINKIKKNTLGNSTSKAANKIGEMLRILEYNVIDEYVYIDLNGRAKRIDFYLPDFNIVVEFYGDYWHCNPKIYKPEQIQKTLKCTAAEIWDRDRDRINNIMNIFDNPSILIIWESTKINIDNIRHYIEILKKNKIKIKI